jgi:hypothetical protein
MGAFTNVYLHGNLEYYPEDKLSIRSDTYVYLNALYSKYIDIKNYSSFTGISYHFTTKKQFDPYIALQPGIAYVNIEPAVSITIPGLSVLPEVSGYAPLYSAAIGFNYYAKSIFHLFMEARYVHGDFAASPVALSLDELKVSFGLGFNLRAKKPKGLKKTETEFKP